MGANKISVVTPGLNWSVQAKAKGSAEIVFRLNGKPVFIRTGHKSPAALSKSQQAAKIQEWFERHPVERKGEAKFGVEVSRFIRLQYEGKAEQTIVEALGHLERLERVTGVKSVQQLTKRLVEGRKTALQEGFAPKTWKNFLTTARKFVRFEMVEGNLPADPFVNFKNPSRKLFGRRRTIWDAERYEKTLARLKQPDRAFLEVLYETGMDSADLFRLGPQHILEVTGSNGKKFWKLYKIRAKAKSEEEVIDQPLSTKARAILLPRLKDWWDFGQYSKPVHFSAALLKRVKSAQKKAGFEPMDIKSLRHTFATRHALRFVEGRGGPPMEELRRWMGHARDSRVLERLYIHAKSSGMYQE